MLFRSDVPPTPDKPTVAVPNPTRAAVRFPLQLPVTLHVAGQDFRATTVDVSSTGVLFTMDDLLDVGAELEWTLHLPAEAMGTGADIPVECSGRVVWVREVPPIRVAVMIDEYRIKGDT